MTVVTRFAPSPTGYLHIGGARTALFNYLFAKNTKGKYLLRIEDTDNQRLRKDAIHKIIDGLKWLNIEPDEPPVLQSENIQRHKDVVQRLLEQNKAYYCYTTPQELEQQRAEAQKKNIQFRYNRKWRDYKETPPKNVKPVVRLKCPTSGTTLFKDAILGTVKLDNTYLDDYILLRSDGTPTYMLSAVVDDIDMGITHIIRGDDHLNNTYRQWHLFKGIGGKIPTFAHIPLIHGQDGKKLSKRHGALGIEAYRDLGYLPQAVVNYLAQLGWSHSHGDIFSLKQASTWFSLEACGKSAAKIDFRKLASINAHYIKTCTSDTLYTLLHKYVKDLNRTQKMRIKKAIDSMKMRATTLEDFPQLWQFALFAPPLKEEEGAEVLDPDKAKILQDVAKTLENISPWTFSHIETILKDHIQKHSLQFRDVAQPMRAVLSGGNKGPTIFEMLEILGKRESLRRLSLCRQGGNKNVSQ